MADTIVYNAPLNDFKVYARDTGTNGMLQYVEEAKYTSYTDDASATVSYYGWASPGIATSTAAWRIMKKTVAGTVTSYTWADGDLNFDNIWNNRASLSYS